MWKYVRRNSPSVMPERPEVLLEADDVPDRRVLLLAQRGAGDLPFGEPIAGREQRRRAQEAADVVGAKGRRRAQTHDKISSIPVSGPCRRLMTEDVGVVKRRFPRRPS